MNVYHQRPGNRGNTNNGIFFQSATALILFVIYAWSTSPTVVFEDDGFFIMSAYYNGISHPPGYPLYTLMAHLVTLIPYGSVALRVHLLSGFFAALTCAVVWRISYQLLRNEIVALCVSLAAGIANIFWAQSIISEVYSLNCFFMVVMIALCLKLNKIPDFNGQDRTVKLLFFIYGLSLTNHWPLIILSTPMLMAILWPQRKYLDKYLRRVWWVVPGLLPYVWMVYRSQMNPEISFYGPIRSFYDFWFFVSREGYANVDHSLSAGWVDKLLFMKFTLQQTVYQYGVPGFCFMVIGFIYQWKIWPRYICTGFVLGYLGSTFILIFLLWFDYDELHRNIFRVYPIVAYMVTSFWIGAGILALLNTLEKYKNRIQLKSSFVAISVLMLVCGTTFANNVADNYRGHDFWARIYAYTILDNLPENSVLFIKGDTDVGPIGYFNRVEGYRSDIELYHLNGVVFKNRLYRPYTIGYQQIKDRFKQFITSDSREIFMTENDFNDFGIEDYGFFIKVIKDKKAPFFLYVIKPEFLNYWNHYAKTGLPRDPWEKMNYYQNEYRGCKLINNIILSSQEDKSVEENFDKYRQEYCNNLMGIYIEIETEIKRKVPDWNHVGKLIDLASKHMNESLLKSTDSSIYSYRGLLALHNNDRDAAISNFRKSVSIWNDPENPSITELKKLEK